MTKKQTGCKWREVEERKGFAGDAHTDNRVLYDWRMRRKQAMNLLFAVLAILGVALAILRELS